LGGNSGIGDGGVAALAAALRTIPSSGEEGDAILDELDLSACGVGDAGVGALAMAIESNPGCVKRLDLSNNGISDEGIIAFSKGLINGYQNSKMCCMDSLDISNNVDIGDEGAEALFDALECGAIRSISLRSCSIRWRGVVALGTSLGNMFGSEMKDDARPRTIEIDLSGNCIGKEEKKKKASVQTNMMNSMSFIGKRLKSGLKDVGLSSMMMGSSMESDDEAELMDSMGSEFADDQASISRCGAAELYTILSQDIDTSSKTRAPTTKNKVKLGMRMCNFDERGIDAIGASCVLFGDHANVQLCVDCEMNGDACEDKSVAKALLNGDFKNNLLIELAKRHVEVTDGYNDFDEDYIDDFGEDSYDREYYH
jgi:Ran GTPase-activating protein (RanGAP) involved in mRNA processing and transport